MKPSAMDHQEPPSLVSIATDLLLELKQAVCRAELEVVDGGTFLSAWLPDARTAVANAERYLQTLQPVQVANPADRAIVQGEHAAGSE